MPVPRVDETTPVVLTTRTLAPVPVAWMALEPGPETATRPAVMRMSPPRPEVARMPVEPGPVVWTSPTLMTVSAPNRALVIRPVLFAPPVRMLVAVMFIGPPAAAGMPNRTSPAVPLDARMPTAFAPAVLSAPA